MQIQKGKDGINALKLANGSLCYVKWTEKKKKKKREVQGKNGSRPWIFSSSSHDKKERWVESSGIDGKRWHHSLEISRRANTEEPLDRQVHLEESHGMDGEMGRKLECGHSGDFRCQPRTAQKKKWNWIPFVVFISQESNHVTGSNWPRVIWMTQRRQSAFLSRFPSNGRRDLEPVSTCDRPDLITFARQVDGELVWKSEAS